MGQYGSAKGRKMRLRGGQARLVAVSKDPPLSERVSVLSHVGGCFRPALYLELAEDGGHMVLDGFLGEVDVARDLCIGRALGQKGEDLGFSPRQPREFFVPPQNRAL